MKTKLTLMVDESVINLAKKYAERHKVSLSGIVEKYFNYLLINSHYSAQKKLHREIEDIIGIIKVPENFDIKKEYRQNREKKALHE